MAIFPPQRLIVERLRDGGWVVLLDDARQGTAREPVFACSEMRVLLAYLEMRLAVPNGEM